MLVTFSLLDKWLGKIIDPDREISTATIGDEGAGKSSLHYVFEADLEAFIAAHRSRIPTTQPGKHKHRYKIGLPGAAREDTWWIGRDYPHDIAVIGQQILEMLPRVIFVVLQHGRYQHIDIENLFRALAIVLRSKEYLEKTTPGKLKKLPTNWRVWTWWKKSSWTRRYWKARSRCTHIVVMYNKMDLLEIDLWKEMGVENPLAMPYSPDFAGTEKWVRARRAGVLQHSIDWLKRSDGPLEEIKDRFRFLYVGTQLTRAQYVPYTALSGEPQDIKKLITLLIKQLERDR